MTLKYVGNRQYTTRLAEFNYTDAERERFAKIASYFENVLGFQIDTSVANWAAIEVVDHDEFVLIMEYFKQAKRQYRK